MILALLLKYWKDALIGVLVLSLIASCVARDHRIAAKAVAQVRSRQADSVLRVITPQLVHTDTLLIRDTIKVRVAVERVVTLRDTVLRHLTDTVLVKQFVTRADSAAHACTELSNDCATFRALANQKMAALQAKLDARPAVQTRSCTVSNVVAGGLSIAGGFFLGRRR